MVAYKYTIILGHINGSIYQDIWGHIKKFVDILKYLGHIKYVEAYKDIWEHIKIFGA